MLVEDHDFSGDTGYSILDTGCWMPLGFLIVD